MTKYFSASLVWHRHRTWVEKLCTHLGLERTFFPVVILRAVCHFQGVRLKNASNGSWELCVEDVGALIKREPRPPSHWLVESCPTSNFCMGPLWEWKINFYYVKLLRFWNLSIRATAGAPFATPKYVSLGVTLGWLIFKKLQTQEL